MDPIPTIPQTVAVIGCGLIGRRIALVWALCPENKVTLFDINPDTARDALTWIQSKLPQYAAPGHDVTENVTISESMEKAVQDTWMVVECTAEDMDIKTRVLGQLNQLANARAIIATNSSFFKSGDLVSQVSEVGQGRVLNCHYFLPPEIPLVELMSCGRTNPRVFSSLLPQLRKIGLHPIVCQAPSTGLIANRIWAAIKREVMMVLAEGVASPEAIDKAFRCGFQANLAPCQIMDHVGLHTVCAIENHYIQERGYLPKRPVDFIRENYVERGHIGRASGRGLYNYPESTEQDRPSLHEELIGAWELVEHSTSPVGNPTLKHHTLGSRLKGTIMYTQTGYVSVLLRFSEELSFDAHQPPDGVPPEIAQRGMQYLAYSGPISLDEQGSEPVLQHHVVHCNLPSWQGHTQRRVVRLGTQGGSKVMVLQPEESKGNTLTSLVWQKLPDQRQSQRKTRASKL